MDLDVIEDRSCIGGPGSAQVTRPQQREDGGQRLADGMHGERSSVRVESTCGSLHGGSGPTIVEGDGHIDQCERKSRSEEPEARVAVEIVGSKLQGATDSRVDQTKLPVSIKMKRAPLPNS